MNSSKLLTESMGNCKGKISKESKSQMRREAYRPTSSKPDTMQGQETGNVGDKLDNKNGNKEDAVVINAKLPFVNPESQTKSETVLQGTGSNKSVSDTNGLKANDYMGKQDKKQNESNAIPEKPVEKPNKDVLSTENIKNNKGEETNFNEAPTSISLNKVPGSKSDDAEIDKPYLFSKGAPEEEPQTEDLGFTDKITGIQDSEPTDQSSSSHETVPTEKAIDEDKSSTTEDDKLQPGNTSSDKLQPKNTPSDKSQPENAPSDNQQNNDDSTGYNRSKFSNPGDEQDKKMSKEMKESDGQKRKKKKKKPDKYDPPPNAIIQNYYGHVDVLILGNDNVYMGKKEKKEEKVETFQPTSTISALEMKVLLKVSESVGIFHGPGETGTCWRVGKDKVMTAAHVVKHNIWSTFHNFLNENKYKECYVDFNYNGKKSKDTDSKYVFDIEKTVYFDPDTLDVAVLKLKRETHKEFPPPLESFKILDPEKNDDQHIYLIGHDKGDKLHINYGMGLWNPTEKRLKDLEKFFVRSMEKENGYKELDRKDRLVIQCKFVSGASGCPGVIIHEDKATVVLIYTEDFQIFILVKTFGKKRREFPNERLLQQGVNIGPVFKSMTRNKMYLDFEMKSSHIKPVKNNNS
ncbi:unnamed protein product [Mytilus coruscus]|uniref:Peptidase S1 domain-containing protein n=1 Tax=Mytilus coruscus TaxID=42192 RepID=A0A6J8ABT2_MYTCO|nr:unnamed protein product [Mytilus coruscus]